VNTAKEIEDIIKFINSSYIFSEDCEGEERYDSYRIIQSDGSYYVEIIIEGE